MHDSPNLVQTALFKANMVQPFLIFYRAYNCDQEAE